MSLKEDEDWHYSSRAEVNEPCFSLAAKKKRSKRNRIAAKPTEYDYNDLLQRLYHTLREEDPEGTLLRSQWRITMKTPQVIPGLPQEFVVSNFVELGQLIQREPTHIQAWMQSRLNAHSTITAEGWLSLSARVGFTLAAHEVARAFQDFVNKYVLCRTCKFPGTELQQGRRNWICSCLVCGDRHEVQAV